MLPQEGYLFRALTELAGWGPLGGDVSFSNFEAEMAGALRVPLPGVSAARTGISLGGGLRFGMLYPLPFGYGFGGYAMHSRINDRFQLGGPTDVRGFKLGGLGPHDGAEAVGGDLITALGSSAVRFCMSSAASELANCLPSTAVVFGFVYAHPVARFELNFSLPLVLRKGEEGRKGLQVGVGINFL